MTDLLTVAGLETQFRTREGLVHAVNGVSFNLKEGETLGIVGEKRLRKERYSHVYVAPDPFATRESGCRSGYLSG